VIICLVVKKWHKIYEALKTRGGLHLRNEGQLKRFFEGLPFVRKSGCPWRSLHRPRTLPERGLAQGEGSGGRCGLCDDPSRLARILHEATRVQVGISWARLKMMERETTAEGAQ
jgi:hypothetical protein